VCVCVYMCVCVCVCMCVCVCVCVCVCIYIYIYIYIYARYNNLSCFLYGERYKYLLKLNLLSCPLSNQQQPPTLISIIKVPSVSYCSTLILYVVFNFLCIVYFTKCASQYIREKALICGQSRYNFRYFGGGGGGGRRHTNLTVSYISHSATSVLLTSVITNVSISAFTTTVLFYILFCHESDQNTAYGR